MEDRSECRYVYVYVYEAAADENIHVVASNLITQTDRMSLEETAFNFKFWGMASRYWGETRSRIL